MNAEINHNEKITSLAEKIAIHDQELKSINSWLDAISKKVDAILSNQAEIGKPNYGVLWAAIGVGIAAISVILTVVGAFWYASVSPITKDLDRANRDSDRLAAAVVLQDKSIQLLKDEVVTITAIQKANTTKIDEMERYGSASADKRLTLLEWQVQSARPHTQPFSVSREK
jgi:hypothetical protein